MERLSNSAVARRVAALKEQVAEAALRCGRAPDDVRVMAVTKHNSAARVNEAIEAGIRLLGENRAQELLEKHAGYRLEGCSVHFIGHLQTNKVRRIIDKVDLIESLDRESLAAEIDRCAAARGRIMPALVEVNIAGEESKSGVLPDRLEEFLCRIASFRHLSVAGLMAIPPAEGSEREKEGYFNAIRRLFIDISAKNIDNVSMDVLSMGMSYDFPLAIKHGSNIVRLGRAIFGERQ